TCALPIVRLPYFQMQMCIQGRKHLLAFKFNFFYFGVGNVMIMVMVVVYFPFYFGKYQRRCTNFLLINLRSRIILRTRRSKEKYTDRYNKKMYLFHVFDKFKIDMRFLCSHFYPSDGRNTENDPYSPYRID